MIFDAHSDVFCDVAQRREAGERNVLERCHLPALRQGGVEGGVWVLWVDPNGGLDDVTATARLLAHARAELADCPAVCPVGSWEELEQAKRTGKFYVLPGVEGMAAIGGEVRGVDWYFSRGVRWGMLSWNEENALATGVGGSVFRGLSAAGRSVVRRMETLGMAVDVSHLNERSFWDVMDAASAPVAASHSNCRALCDVPRNLTDEQLRAIRDSGGVIGVNAYHGFVHRDSAKQTLETLALHAAHIIDVCGVDHAGCGFDFCAYLGPGNEPAAGIEGPQCAPRLLDCLKAMGLRDDEAEKMARGNWLRLLREILPPKTTRGLPEMWKIV